MRLVLVVVGHLMAIQLEPLARVVVVQHLLEQLVQQLEHPLLAVTQHHSLEHH
jgi:hypothetical protein